MVKSLHCSLEAKLASINPPDYSDSEDDDKPELSAKVASQQATPSVNNKKILRN
jgi:hypothetical protein